MLISIPKRPDDREAPGPWWHPLTTPEGTNATVRCPNCGSVFTLTDHTIAPNGAVSPSILCAASHCNWHVYGHLVDWGLKETEAPEGD
jgi:predicted Zn finger-like uncharacterized protein